VATLTKRPDFFNSKEGEDIRETLRFIDADIKYNTSSSYSANSLRYPDNKIPFVDKHMNYLNSHPQLDVWKYIANIRLMTKVK